MCIARCYSLETNSALVHVFLQFPGCLLSDYVCVFYVLAHHSSSLPEELDDSWLEHHPIWRSNQRDSRSQGLLVAWARWPRANEFSALHPRLVLLTSAGTSSLSVLAMLFVHSFPHCPMFSVDSDPSCHLRFSSKPAYKSCLYSCTWG